MRKILRLAPALLLAGCTVGPNYTAPEVHTPDAFQELPSLKTQNLVSVPTVAAADLTQWWRTIDDAELHKLIAQALTQNLDLQSAAARVRAAREQEIIAGAAAQPHVSASALAAKLHSGSNPLASLSGGGGSSGGGSSGDSNINLYSLGFDATWEIDVFGGVRREVEAARANTAAALWQMRDGEVSLTAEIATDYMTLRATQARLALVASELRSQENALNLIVARMRAGFVTALDVNQQKSAVAATAAQVPGLEAEARAMEHAIAVLMAEEPEALTFELDPPVPVPAMPAELPVGLPSDLLRRRPDIREAERKLAAATAEEGAAVANLYPRFNLLAALSLVSGDIGKLFSSDSFSQIAAGQVAWPIFTGGKVHANIRAKHQEELEAYYAYRAAVLKAISDCEDALVRYKNEQQRMASLADAVAAGRSSYDLSAQQYSAGLITYVTVLTTQAQYTSAQDQLMQSRQTLAQDLMSLFKALGGGWSTDEPAQIEPGSPH